MTSDKHADTQGSGKDEMGGGALLPWAVAQALLDSDGSRFATVAVAKDQPVRIVELTTGVPAFHTVGAPISSGQCDPFPTALAGPWDVDGDGLDDFLVLDPGCGNWIGLQRPDGMYESVPWESQLSPLTVRHYVEVLDLDGDGSGEVVVSTYDGFEVAWLKDVEPSRIDFGWPQTNHMYVTTMLVPLDRSRWLFQREGAFSTFLPTADGTIEVDQMIEQVDLELLKPFEGYDQLVPLSLPNCQDFAAGVGIFTRNVEVPRRLALLRYGETNYKAVGVETLGDQVFLVAAATVDDRSLIGIVSGAPETFFVEVFEHSDCGLLAPLGHAEIPHLPRFDVDPTLEQFWVQSGEQVIAFSASSGITLQFATPTALYRWHVTLSPFGVDSDMVSLE
jgi:hypothetical protein